MDFKLCRLKTHLEDSVAQTLVQTCRDVESVLILRERSTDAQHRQE